MTPNPKQSKITLTKCLFCQHSSWKHFANDLKQPAFDNCRVGQVPAASCGAEKEVSKGVRHTINQQWAKWLKPKKDGKK